MIHNLETADSNGRLSEPELAPIDRLHLPCRLLAMQLCLLRLRLCLSSLSFPLLCLPLCHFISTGWPRPETVEPVRSSDQCSQSIRNCVWQEYEIWFCTGIERVGPARSGLAFAAPCGRVPGGNGTSIPLSLVISTVAPGIAASLSRRRHHLL